MDYGYRSTQHPHYSTQYPRRDPLGYSSYSAPYRQTPNASTRTAYSTQKQSFSDRPTTTGRSAALRGSGYKAPSFSYLDFGNDSTNLSQSRRPVGSSSKQNTYGGTTSRLYNNATVAPSSSTLRPPSYDTYSNYKISPDTVNTRELAGYESTPSARSLHPSGYAAPTSTTNRIAQPPSQNTRKYPLDSRNMDIPQQPPRTHQRKSPPQPKYARSGGTNRQNIISQYNADNNKGKARRVNQNASATPMDSRRPATPKASPNRGTVTQKKNPSKLNKD